MDEAAYIRRFELLLLIGSNTAYGLIWQSVLLQLLQSRHVSYARYYILI